MGKVRSVGSRIYFWPGVAAILLVLQVVLPHILHRPAFDSYANVVVLVLLLLSTWLAALNAVQNVQGARTFWFLMAIGFGLWAVDASLWAYYTTILGKEVLDLPIADPALFLHVVPFMAALATRPHLNQSGQKLYRTTLNFFLLLFFWLFLYAYLVLPYYDPFRHSAVYNLRYDRLYLIESLAWIAALGFLFFRAQSPWKNIYRHLFFASALYAASSWFGNRNLDSTSYYSWTLYGVGLLASCCWYIWAMLRARLLPERLIQPARRDTKDARYTPLLAMIIVGMILVLGIEELFWSEPTPGFHRLRMIVVLVFVFFFALSVFIKDYLDQRNLIGEIHATEALGSAILSSLENNIAVLDGQGTIITVNEAWIRFAMENEGRAESSGPGTNYIEACLRVTDTSPEMQGIVDGIKAVQKRLKPVFWREYPCHSPHRQRWYLMTVTPLDAIAGGVVVSHAEITELKKAEAALRESEARFRVMADSAPVLMWMAGPDQLVTYLNQNWLDFTGQPVEAQLGTGWVNSVHPEDVAMCHQIYTEAFDRRERFEMEYRLRRDDGVYRWIVDIGVPRFSADNSFAGYIGSCIDVTEHRIAEEMLSNLSRRLIDAQEQERRRIARDLHDDINQRLALLGVKIGSLKRNPPGSREQLLQHLQELSEGTTDIGNSVHSISHQLHSSQLDYLGLVSAAEGLCIEFAAQQHVEIDFVHHDVPAPVPQAVSLCLFRVLQETLTNAVKHSGSTSIEVQLWGDSGNVHLAVSDMGSGFDVKTAQRAKGLGLISMRERVHSVNGTLAVRSKPDCGTEIRVTVPVETSMSEAPSSAD